MKRFFTLEYWTDDGWYVGRLKEVPGIFSQGETLDELKENINDAYYMMINSDIESPCKETHILEIGVEM
ncbi:type II toxin-antitoxin system HicB family antitoxin [Peptococcaceae bacterium]|nr:type II toxin-antitoxin system HicB family antitoxin [Peptococcaceae bacterium]